VRVFKESAAQMARTLFHPSRPSSRTDKWPARERAAEVGSGAEPVDLSARSRRRVRIEWALLAWVRDRPLRQPLGSIVADIYA
jgi:hypothetical protein